MTQTYDAGSIRILKPGEAQEKFSWLKAENLAIQYSRPLEFIGRGIEACRRSSVNLDYFINRYLEEDRSVEKNLLVEQAFLELMREAREKSQSRH